MKYFTTNRREKREGVQCIRLGLWTNHDEIPVLPGGLNSGLKAQKGQGNKDMAERICVRNMAEFYQKDPEKIVLKNSLFYSHDTYSVTKKKINLTSTDP